MSSERVKKLTIYLGFGDFRNWLEELVQLTDKEMLEVREFLIGKAAACQLRNDKPGLLYMLQRRIKHIDRYRRGRHRDDAQTEDRS